MKRILMLAATGVLLLGLAGSGLHAAESLNKVPAVNKPPATRATDLKRPAPTTLICPDTITVADITTKTSDMPGFTGVTVGNVPATFAYETTGRASSTQCFCQYRNGDIRASIHAAMLGYHSCNASIVPKPGGGTTTGILLYRSAFH